MHINDMLLKESPKVLGSEVATALPISLKSILEENFGTKPQKEADIT